MVVEGPFDGDGETVGHHVAKKGDGVSAMASAWSSCRTCRWVSPTVGDSSETVGRRTYYAGECPRMASMTQVRGTR